MVQNLMRIGAQMVQNQVWRGSGELLGGSGGFLGVSWLQGTSVPLPWRLLGSFSAVLEASWAPLGRLLGRWAPSWGVLGRPGGILEAFCSDFKAPSPFLSLTSDFAKNLGEFRTIVCQLVLDTCKVCIHDYF